MRENSEKSKILEKSRKEAEKSIQKTVKKIQKELESRKRVDLGKYPIEKIKRELREIIVAGINFQGLGRGDIKLEIPPEHVKADLSFAVFDLAKKAKTDPKSLAEKICNIINESELAYIEKAKAAGPYVNLNLNKNFAYADILSGIARAKDKYGESDVGAGKVVLIDYSSPNIAKPFGVGHLRSTIIGQALANIYHKTGFSVIKDNHLGDWGTQFGKLIYAYEKWGDKNKIKYDPIGELNNLYIKFHKEAETNPDMEDKAREIFKKMEAGDPKLLRLWHKFKKISVLEFKKIYDKLGVNFDMYLGESHFLSIDGVIEQCLQKNIAKKDESGAIIVDSLSGIPSFLLRKQDGSSLYAARDLAAIKFRVETFKPDMILYAVGEEQSLNFKQLFALSEAIGYTDGTKVKHIGFGLVLMEGKKMSTRKGTLVELEDLIGESVSKSKQIMTEKDKGLSPEDLDKISEVVGIGAIIYNDLRQSRTKNISFDWERMLDFEGGSAVYLQYTYARINSIIKKLESLGVETKKPAMPVFEKDSEFALAKKMMFYPEIILESQKNDSPHLIAIYLEELAQLFNHFYNDVSIIGTEDKKIQQSRAALIESVAVIIKNGLSLLNVKVAERI